MLSNKAKSVLIAVSNGPRPCHDFNRQIIDTLRQNGLAKIIIKRGPVIQRFCKITPEGQKYIAENGL